MQMLDTWTQSKHESNALFSPSTKVKIRAAEGQHGPVWIVTRFVGKLAWFVEFTDPYLAIARAQKEEESITETEE